MLLAGRRAALGLATTVTLLGGSFLSPSASAVEPAARAGDRPTARAEAAADWLGGQLRNGLAISEFRDGNGDLQSFTDYGLTLDIYFALRDIGVQPRRRQHILDSIEPHTGAYVGTGATRFAGPLGKLLTAVQRERIDPATYSGGFLLRKLERRVHTANDTEKGRAKDAGSGDFSNAIGQSFVVRALAMAGSDLADEATRFLLRQQCSRGYFRVFLESADHSCDGGTRAESAPSVDATAFAVQALRVADRRGVDVPKRRLRTAVAEAEDWLARRQRPSGAFREDGIANANSTGLAAAVLADLGRAGRADRAAEWLKGRQVTRALARDGALGGERGAVAFDKAAFRKAVANGIGRAVRFEWRRATAQAAPGLDALRRG